MHTRPFACLTTIALLITSFSVRVPAAEHAGKTVRDFGAVGDGQTDDAAAIQKAIDSGIGSIVFPKGTYWLSKTVTIDLNAVGYTCLKGHGVAEIVMAGPGAAFSFVGTHEKSADPQGFADEVWQKQRMPAVEGLGIRGEHPEAEGILARGTMQLTVTRVHGRKLLHVIHLAGNNRNVAIADCHFYENQGCGVFYDNVNLHQSNITGCHISYNAGGGVVSRGGNVRNLHITGCDIESNMAPDAPATANVLIDSAGSPYGTGEVAITGCTIQHNNPSPDSANIRIIGKSAPGRDAADIREGNVTITGNVLSDVQVNIHLRECRGVAISGNTLWQGYRHNLLIENCTAVVLGANNLDRNPRYAYGNTQDANNGCVFRNCDDCLINGLLLTQVWREPAGLILERCRRCVVSGSSVLDCDGTGIVLKDSEFCRIADCIVRDDRPDKTTPSIVIDGGKGNVVAGNILKSPPVVRADAQVILRDNGE